MAVLDDDNNILYKYSKQFDTKVTNNEMEIKAILFALINFGSKSKITAKAPIVYTDSAYCLNIFTNWMYGWKRSGWLKANGEPPENLDLIKAYYDLSEQGYKIRLEKVKGHSGVFGNEIVDKLAKGLI